MEAEILHEMNEIENSPLPTYSPPTFSRSLLSLCVCVFVWMFNLQWPSAIAGVQLVLINAIIGQKNLSDYLPLLLGMEWEGKAVEVGGCWCGYDSRLRQDQRMPSIRNSIAVCHFSIRL